MNERLKEYLEQKLLHQYINDDEEWVDVYITPLNRIDVTIISDIADSMDINEINRFLYRAIFDYLGDEAHKYSVGFLDIYNIEEADDLALRKYESKRDPITWSDVVSLNKKLKSKISDRDYRVICFYSYKGGVGRTTALLQIAYTLAKQGKNLVLIDFDIEAPSFHLLFKEWINNPISGIEYGLVDYLYERMSNVDPREHKIKITDIFVPIKFDETLDGNIYVIPATAKLTNQYIFKLAQLQSHIIFENDYMEDLINKLEATLSFDTVFIDTRTGINQWGAFSLLGFADQIMLIATPNEENIEGLTNVIELMQKAGLDNYVVTMSKFESDSRGINIAKHFFEKLKDLGQEFVGISYIPSLAMTGKYPFVNILEPYKALSDYILESQIIKFNAKFLSNIDTIYILKQIEKSLKSAIIAANKYNGNVSSQAMSSTERKVLTDTNINIVVDHIDYASERLTSMFKEFAKTERKRVIYQDNEGSYVAYKHLLPVYDEGFTINIDEFITQNKNVSDIWLIYLIYLLNKNLEKKFLQVAKGKIKGFEHLMGKSFNEYLEFAKNLDRDSIISVLKDAITGEVVLYDSINKRETRINRPQNMAFCLFNISLKKENINIKDHNSQDNLRSLIGLIECILICKKQIPEIRIILLIDNEFYNSFQDEFDGMKGSLLEIEWKEEDVSNLISRLLDPCLFASYGDAILKNKDIFGDFKDVDRFCLIKATENNISEEELYNNDINSLLGSCEFRQKILDLFWGIRLSSKRYSKTMISWFYEELKNAYKVNSDSVIQVLIKAINYEISARAAINSHNEEDLISEDRILSVDSLKKSIKLIKS